MDVAEQLNGFLFEMFFFGAINRQPVAFFSFKRTSRCSRLENDKSGGGGGGGGVQMERTHVRTDTGKAAIQQWDGS